MKEPQMSKTSFLGLGIAPKIIETLDRMKFTVPTPIQHKTIPIAIEGKDLIGVAQTGTGKTLAFAIPVIQALSQAKARALVVTPTRELALQVDETFRKLAPLFGIRTAVIIGGASMEMQIRDLRRSPRVIIATPGRLIDHMNQHTLKLSDVEFLVLDEADRMLDMGFLPDIQRILKAVPNRRQTMLFSATMPPAIMKIASQYMKLPINVEVAPSGTAAENIVQELFIVKKSRKDRLLVTLLEKHYGPVLIFSRTKRGAAGLKKMLKEMGHKAAEIHSDRTLGQRREALDGFKNGRYKILVATDIAARGIDVIGIELVVNYDLPDDPEQYVHRIGRTGRAGYEGRAVTFATPEQGQEVAGIEKIIKAAIPIAEHPDLPREQFTFHPKPQAPAHPGRTAHRPFNRRRPRRG